MRRLRFRIQILRWVHLLFRRPSPPKCMLHLEWGPGELEGEMLFLQFIPRVGEEVEVEIRNIADEPKRWRVIPETLTGKVTRVKHLINIDYGNDVGPHSFQSVTVYVQFRDLE